MLNRFRPVLKTALASVALGALVPLAACNQALPEQTRSAYGVPDLPATLPLALGEERPLVRAPAAARLPRAKPIKAVRVANPDDYYAYADDAWSYYDALGEAPPDYGFSYDGVEPWAWQGYDDSMMFVEPLDAGYRYYYYRPGEAYPYFIRDPEWGYGYDGGHLAMVYDAYGAVLPYDDYYNGPWLDYASRYYDRGYQLYGASRVRHPVIAASWYDFQPAYTDSFLDWEDDLWRQPNWWAYHERTWDRRDSYWREERARRDAETVRYAAWQDQGFQAVPPPRAIPLNWQRADWARDQRRFVPAVSGFEGSSGDQQRAVLREQQRVASLARPTGRQDRVELAALRERVQRRPGIDHRQTERFAERRRQLEERHVQLASRNDRSAQRERAVLERQAQFLDRAPQNDVRGRRGVEPQRLGAQMGDAAREQRLTQAERRGLEDPQLRQQADARQQRDRRQADAQLQRQAQVDARAQGQQRREAQVQAQAEAQNRRQSEVQARAGAEQQRQSEVQARGEAQQRRQSEVRVRAEAQQRGQAQAQARAEAQQQRQAQAEARRQHDSQARQAVEQRRAAQDQARQQRAQAEAQANARSAQRAQAEAQANARSAQRAQAQQAAEQQRAAAQQARQAGEQQRAQRQQQAQAQAQAKAQAQAQAQAQAAQAQAAQAQAAQARQQRTAQADAAPAANGKPDKPQHGRGHD